MRKFVLLAVALMGFSAAFAQNDVLAVAQEANDALAAKNFAKATELLEKVIADGAESEEDAVLAQVNSAKKNLPIAYFQVGRAAAAAAQKATTPEAKDAKYAEAIAVLNTAMDKATEYKNTTVKNNAGRMLGMVYQSQGGEYFNGGNYEKAAEIFAKGYEADKKNTAMALNLAESYFKMDKYAEGVKICSEVAALPAGQKYDAAIADAKAKIAQYTNNKIAQLQQANDFDGIIAMAETLEDKALAQKLTVQAYLLKKDYDKVIELGEAAAEAQADEADKSTVYFQLGTAYNAKENKAKAIESLKKVTAGASVDAAKAALAELSK
ncbi:MAG: tetratricopeptide repeat protein [Alistipes sp.]|nr:tetratricopeptide repeat protein [Alistipes sp.]